MHHLITSPGVMEQIFKKCGCIHLRNIINDNTYFHVVTAMNIIIFLLSHGCVYFRQTEGPFVFKCT